MTKYSVDWAHKEDKLFFYDGEKLWKKPKLKKGDELYTENIPWKYSRKILQMDIKIFRVHQNIIAQFRKSKGLEKTDEADARLIYEYSQLHPDDFKSYIGEPALKLMYATFKEIQKVRVSTGQRIWAVGEDENNGHILKSISKIEHDIEKEMLAELQNHKIWEWLSPIKGMGAATASGLIAYIGDIERFEMPSHLISYAGLDVINGLAPKKRKGKELNHHPKLKSLLLGIIGDNFRKQRTEIYRNIYDIEKKKELDKRFPPGFLKEKYNGYKEKDIKLSKGHADNRAIRKMMKIFLQHYWVLARQLHGLDTRPPFVHDKLKHKTYIMPPHIPKSLLPFKPF